MKNFLDYELLLEGIAMNIPFSFARYGDGEWNAILGKNGQNCDGHRYFPEMGKALKNILEGSPSYYTGLQNLASKLNAEKPEFDRLVNLNKWCNNEILHRASIKGKINSFFDVLSGKANVCIVGNETLRNFHDWELIEIPLKNCWESYGEMRSRLLQWISTKGFDEGDSIPIVLYCAGMPSNVMIHEMHNLYGDKMIQIDCGSVFDPYVGINSRTYHQKLDLKKS